MQRTWIGLAGLLGGSAVAMAALAAHGLDRLDPVALQQVRSAVQIQGWHALALFGCGLWAPRGGRVGDAAGLLFALGAVLFCAGVYPLALYGIRLPAVAPTGGLMLIAAWLLLAASTLRRR